MIDPAKVMPLKAWEKVLGNLDKESLKSARGVSREWSSVVAVANSAQQKETATRPRPEQVAGLHSAPTPVFIVRVWMLCVFQWAFVVDYVKAYSELGLARVLMAFRVFVPVAVLSFPVGFLLMRGRIYFWLFLVQLLELCVLLLPGFRKAPRLTYALVACLTVALGVLDRRALRGQMGPFLAASVTVLLCIWTMFAHRVPVALTDATGHPDQSHYLPAFFLPMTLPIRCLRFVGWIHLSTEGVETFKVLSVIAGLVALARYTTRTARVSAFLLDLARVMPLSLLGVVLVSRGDLSYKPLLENTAIVSCVMWILSNFATVWFEGNVLKRSKLFQQFAIATVALVPGHVLLNASF